MDVSNKPKTNQMTISQIAAQVSVNIETIRFYERKKLIDQPESLGQVRYYTQEHVDKINLIKKSQSVGFTLAEIKSLLSLRFDPAKDCSPIKEKALEKIHEVETKIKDLKKILKALKTIEHACSGHEPSAKCSIIDGLKDLKL